MKSYLATCVALLLGRRPVCLIDEPEMCLHPPQAYNLGRFIGTHAATNEYATFVATHSSHILRGVLQTAARVQIVRLTRRRGAFSAHLVPASELTVALARPTLRAEAVLDGIFAQAVIVVEADGDRVVYQAAWESVREDVRMDVHFSTVGGTGGIADTVGLYRTLRIPIAVIADLDIIVDLDRMSRVLEKLVDDPGRRSDLLRMSRDVAQAVRSLPPTISPANVAESLAAMSPSNSDWSHDEDLDLRRRLKSLANDLDRMLRLKRGGVAAYPGDLGTRMQVLLDELKRLGLFVVPVGELEEWLAPHDVGVSKSDKRGWSNAAAQAIEKLGRRDDDVWGFVLGVGRFLNSAQNVTRAS